MDPKIEKGFIFNYHNDYLNSRKAKNNYKYFLNSKKTTMSRNICILLLAALFVFAQGSELQRLALNQGRVNLRSLATTDSTEKVTLDFSTTTSNGNNFGVFVNLGEEYLSNNGLTLKNQTDMTVLLYTNVTSFCRDCSELVNYNCSTSNNSCNADTNVEQTFFSPYFYYTKANPVNHSISIGNTTTPSWKLSTNASLYRWSYKSSVQSYYTSWDSSRSAFANTSTYGLLGLGVGGEAASNFKGDHPLFSVSLNSTGYGSLIFGKDTTLYDSSKTPQTLTTDTNWTMVTKNLTFGSNTSFVSNLIFDLQHEGISVPRKYWRDSDNAVGLYTTLKTKYNLSSSSENGYYTYYGNLTGLPNLVFGLENGKTLTVPPAAYAKKSTRYNDTWLLLIGYIDSATNISDSSTTKIDYTILGWPVLSQFYTIFEQKTGSEPTITLYPAKSSSSSSDGSSNSTPTSLGTRAIQLAVVIVILAVVYTCFKNRAAAKLQNDLGEQLNRKASAF